MTGANSDKATVQARRGPTLLWRIVAEGIQRDITSGKYKPGDRLPSENELASAFDVHRNTIRRALEVLQDRDTIRIKHGLGSFVSERLIRHRVGPDTRLTAALRDLDRAGERRYLGATRVRADKALARDLRIAKGRFVRKVDTMTLVDGNAVAVSSSYFPLPRFEKIENFIEETGSFTEAWRRFGIVDYRRYEMRLTAIALSAPDAKLLGLARQRPAMLTTNINVDASDVPILVSYTRWSPQHLELVVRF